jgi:putative FmdB family regulatory protein
MPNYDFKCFKCGGVQEIYKSFGDDTLPVCCGHSMDKIFTVPGGIHFKGGGWGGQG